MILYNLVLGNLVNSPLICLVVGLLLAFIKSGLRLPRQLNNFLTIYILFCIGFKGGGPLLEQSSSLFSFLSILGLLIGWGLLHPFFSFYLLKRFTLIDSMTAAAISASFGSVSIMTFVGAISFLERLQVDYQQLIIAVLVFMEIPAIISGIFLAKIDSEPVSKDLRENMKMTKVIKEAIFNKAIIAIVLGLFAGLICYSNKLNSICHASTLFFKPSLCLFMLDMGLLVGLHKHHFKLFSWPLGLFGVYMPLIGAAFGLLFSFFLKMDAGTGTLIAVLTASASYIAVPAAMRIAVPMAKEALYLPLSLGIAFPFNIAIGIPLYYYFANWILK